MTLNIESQSQNIERETTILNYIKVCNLEDEMINGESAFDYMVKITNKYLNNPHNIEIIEKLFQKSIYKRFYLHILLLHSLIKSQKINLDQEAIQIFMEFYYQLYFDRDDGFDNCEPLNTVNPTITSDLNINYFMSNRLKQVNLISFLEKQQKPDYELRSNPIIINKLVDMANIFQLLGYRVVIFGSKLVCSNNMATWHHTPYKFSYPNINLFLSKYPINCVNIYLDVDFNPM